MINRLACSRVANRWPRTHAVFSRTHRLSVGALSQQLPLRDIELWIRHAVKVSWNSWLQYWLPLRYERSGQRLVCAESRPSARPSLTSEVCCRPAGSSPPLGGCAGRVRRPATASPRGGDVGDVAAPHHVARAVGVKRYCTRSGATGKRCALSVITTNLRLPLARMPWRCINRRTRSLHTRRPRASNSRCMRGQPCSARNCAWMA